MSAQKRAVDVIQFEVLQAVVDLIIPQDDNTGRIDIAATLVHRRETDFGDGWRFADMPPDKIAFNSGLMLLNETAIKMNSLPFFALQKTQQIKLLTQIQNGEIAWHDLDGKHWFEDILCEATEVYVSHPMTLSRMGFSGIAFLPRWNEIGLNTAQPWEPSAH